MFNAELIFFRNSLAASVGFLSVVQDSYDSENLFLIALLNNLCDSVLGYIVVINRLLLLKVTLTYLTPSVV